MVEFYRETHKEKKSLRISFGLIWVHLAFDCFWLFSVDGAHWGTPQRAENTQWRPIGSDTLTTVYIKPSPAQQAPPYRSAVHGASQRIGQDINPRGVHLRSDQCIYKGAPGTVDHMRCWGIFSPSTTSLLCFTNFKFRFLNPNSPENFLNMKRSCALENYRGGTVYPPIISTATA